MTNLIKEMAKGYLDAFEAYKTNDDNLKIEIESFKVKFNKLTNEIDDPADFFTSFVSSNLQSEYTDLITKLAISTVEVSKESSKPDLSVIQFTDQYKSVYDELKKIPYQTRTHKAYEDIFDVAERTADMLEAQIIIEKERMLWKIISENYFDIYNAIVEASDPIDEYVSTITNAYFNTYTSANNEEELTYLLEKLEIKLLDLKSRNEIKLLFIGLLNVQFINYVNAKNNIYKWADDSLVKGYIATMLSAKKAILRIIKFIEEEFSITINDIFEKENYKIWLLNPMPKDGLFRIKKSLNPQNLIVYQDILENEILPDLNIKKIILRKLKLNFYPKIDGKEYDEIVDQEVEKLNKEFNYFKYQDTFTFEIK